MSKYLSHVKFLKNVFKTTTRPNSNNSKKNNKKKSDNTKSVGPMTDPSKKINVEHTAYRLDAQGN